jgi:hypothetical protein
MRCPKCQFDHELQTTECLKCGIVFARYQAALEAALKPAGPIDAFSKPAGSIGPAPNGSPLPAGQARPPLQSNAPAKEPGQVVGAALDTRWKPAGPVKLWPIEPDSTEFGEKYDARRELKYRVFALPLALLVARFLAGTGWRAAVRMLSMVLHESGHALTAMLTGRWAVPMPWVTMHGEERSFLIVLAVTAAIGFGGFKAWVARRWTWVGVFGAVLIVQLLCLTVWRYYAECMIIFFGDGGALVLATILMALFYIDHESALYKSWGLRWGFLAIGALAFMDVYRTWTGPFEDIPFGEMEGVNLSDPSLLMEMYGWSVLRLVDRYILLARICLVALAVIYVWGLASTYLETLSPASHAEGHELGHGR